MDDDSYIPALSIRQPWADLILDGRKSVEIRSWTTDYRGPICIHVSKKEDPVLEGQYGTSLSFRGGFAGFCELVSVVPFDPARWEKWRPQHFDPGPYPPGNQAWILTKPTRLPVPLPARGHTLLFNPEPADMKYLRAAYRNLGLG